MSLKLYIGIHSRTSDNRKKSEMRTYEDSSKSKKTIASMIETKGGKSQQSGGVKNKEVAAAEEKAAADYGKTESELDEETRMANLQALMSKRGKKGKELKKNLSDFCYLACSMQRFFPFNLP